MIFFIVFGGIFFFVGLSIFVGMLIGYFLAGDIMFLLFSLLFGIVFCGIGIGTFIAGFKTYRHRKEIINLGFHTKARVIDYDDNTTTYVNGVPLLDLIVLFEYHGISKIAKLSTNSTHSTQYPINSLVDVSVYGQEIILVK